MARRRHTPEQIVRKLREGDRLLNEGKELAEVARHLEVSEPTYHRWRAQYGGMKADDAKRLRELERENRELKQIHQLHRPRLALAEPVGRVLRRTHARRAAGRGAVRLAARGPGARRRLAHRVQHLPPALGPRHADACRVRRAMAAQPTTALITGGPINGVRSLLLGHTYVATHLHEHNFVFVSQCAAEVVGLLLKLRYQGLVAGVVRGMSGSNDLHHRFQIV